MAQESRVRVGGCDRSRQPATVANPPLRQQNWLVEATLTANQ